MSTNVRKHSTGIVQETHAPTVTGPGADMATAAGQTTLTGADLHEWQQWLKPCKDALAALEATIPPNAEANYALVTGTFRELYDGRLPIGGFAGDGD